MNKLAPDSVRSQTALPHELPVAGWGHALAAMGDAEQEAQSLTEIIANLPANAVHEIFAASRADTAAMAGFGVMLALMLTGDAPCFFVHAMRRESATLYPPGLAQLGLDPGRCFCVQAPDLLAALRATADIARSDAAGTVLVEIDGNPRLLDLTASRRLALAAEKSGTAVLLLRSSARAAPSAAYSRWQVSSAPSTPLLADAPGTPAFAVTLLRHRRMAAGLEARLVWNFEERRFDEQTATPTPQHSSGEAASGDLVSVDARREADPYAQSHGRHAA